MLTVTLPYFQYHVPENVPDTHTFEYRKTYRKNYAPCTGKTLYQNCMRTKIQNLYHFKIRAYHVLKWYAYHERGSTVQIPFWYYQKLYHFITNLYQMIVIRVVCLIALFCKNYLSKTAMRMAFCQF